MRKQENRYIVYFKDGGQASLTAKTKISAARKAREGMVGLPVPEGETPCTEPPEVDRIIQLPNQ
jgi:hypothetical protein